MSDLTAKLTLSLTRTLLIFSLLGLSANFLCAFQQAAIKKTKYEFTDNRVSEADSLLAARQYQSALEAYEKAYTTYASESFYEGMVYAKERMGRTYRSLGKDSLSQLTYSAAAVLSRERLGPNHMLESKAYLNNGIRAHFNEKPVEASKLLDSAKMRYDNSSLQDSSIFKEIINYKYYTYYYSNLSRDTLIKYLNERGRIYDVEGSTLEQNVFFLSDYCRAYYKIGDFQKATAYGLEAVRISENSLELIDPYYYRDALFNLTRSLWSQKRFNEALEMIDKLIDYSEQNAPKGDFLPGYYNLRALILTDKKDYQSAANQFLKLIKLLESNTYDDGTFRDATIRDAIMNLGVCYQAMGEYVKAQKYLNRALLLEKEVNTLFDTPFSDRYRYMGQYYYNLGQYSDAFSYYDSAIRNSVLDYKAGLLEYPQTEGFNPTFDNLSIIKEKQISLERLYSSSYSDSSEMLEAAIAYAQTTHEYIIKNREQLQISQGRLFLSESFKSLYESAINSVYLLYQSKQENNLLDLAATFFSLSKSILFLEQSGELGEIQDSRLPLSTKNSFYQIKNDIEKLESKFFELISEVNKSDSLRLVNEELLRLDGKLKSFRDSIKSIFQTTRNFPDQKNGIPTYLEKFLSDKPGHVIVDFFIGDRYTFVMGISRDEKVLTRVVLDSSFYSQTDMLIDKLTKRPEINSYRTSIKEYQSSAFGVYSKIVSPIIEEFKSNITDITFVPDDFLGKIPFEALVSKVRENASSFSQLQYLVNSYNIDYALSTLSIQRDDHSRQAKKLMFGIGYSGKGNSRDRDSELGGLPGTDEEIMYLEKNIAGDFFLGESGTKELFMNEAKNYDILHLAVHGMSDENNRYGSKLIFNNNDILKTADLYVADLKARLVVLSACESGTGELSKGEGVFSIARGFAIVGVPSVVMSLWNVNDRVSSDLMVSFHQNLDTELTVGKALTKTKRTYLENSDEFTSHPYYWSAFVALGGSQEIEQSNGFKKMYFLFIFFPIVLIIFSYKKRKGAVKPLL